MHAAADDPIVSVIVPVRDGAADLPGLVRALEAQTLPRSRFELLLGDDGSVDGGPDAVAAGADWIGVVGGPPQNAYTARNRAVAAARGSILAFCDADCRPEPEWLAAGVAALEGADLAAGEIRFALPERRTLWTLLELETYKDHERQVAAANAETANLFVRREVFDRLGGFDDSVPEHGDFDFVERAVSAGARLVYAPDAVVTHPTRDRARAFLRSVWNMHRSYAARESAAGRLPEGLKLRSWLPLVQALRARRRFGRTLRLDRRRLRAHAVRPSLREDALALPVMYVLLPYLGGAAQLHGWRLGRRRR